MFNIFSRISFLMSVFLTLSYIQLMSMYFVIHNNTGSQPLSLNQIVLSKHYKAAAYISLKTLWALIHNIFLKKLFHYKNIPTFVTGMLQIFFKDVLETSASNCLEGVSYMFLQTKNTLNIKVLISSAGDRNDILTVIMP